MGLCAQLFWTRPRRGSRRCSSVDAARASIASTRCGRVSCTWFPHPAMVTRAWASSWPRSSAPARSTSTPQPAPIAASTSGKRTQETINDKNAAPHTNLSPGTAEPHDLPSSSPSPMTRHTNSPPGRKRPRRTWRITASCARAPLTPPGEGEAARGLSGPGGRAQRPPAGFPEHASATERASRSELGILVSYSAVTTHVPSASANGSISPGSPTSWVLKIASAPSLPAP